MSDLGGGGVIYKSNVNGFFFSGEKNIKFLNSFPKITMGVFMGT